MDMEDIVHKIKAGIYDLSWKEKRNSDIWNIFAEIKKEDGSILEGYLCCSKCFRLLRFDGKRTSNFNRHKCYSSLKDSASISIENIDALNECSRSASYVDNNLEDSDPILQESEDSESQHCESSLKFEIYRGSINSHVKLDEVGTSSPTTDLLSSDIEPEYCEPSARTCKDTEDILQKISDGVYKLSQKRKGKSEIWNVFAEIRHGDGSIVEGYLCCRKCMRLFKFNGKQTSNLNRHKCYSSALKETRIQFSKSLPSAWDGGTYTRERDPIASSTRLHKFLFDDENDISSMSSSTDQQKNKEGKPFHKDEAHRIIVDTNLKSPQHSPIKQVPVRGDSSKSSKLPQNRTTKPGTSQKYAKQLDGLCEMIKADLQDLPEELFFNAKWKIMDVLRNVHSAKLKDSTQFSKNCGRGEVTSDSGTRISSIEADQRAREIPELNDGRITLN